MIGPQHHRPPLAHTDVLPGQFFDLLRRRSPLQGERRLMIAILEDAINCIQKYLLAHRHAERKLFEEARTWMLSDSTDPFSFQHVCDVIGLDPAYLRGGMERWCRRELPPHATWTSPLTTPAGAASDRCDRSRRQPSPLPHLRAASHR